MIGALRTLARPRVLWLLLFGWGFALCYATGLREIFALDQAILYDGAWRILQGQVPYRDFVTPMGISPILMQAAIFQVFSISWHSYVAHAAVYNGLYGILVLGFMSRAAAPRWLAVLVAFCSGVVFYPPFGTPYVDQHAFFFSLLACYLMLVIETSPSAALQNLAAFAVPWCIVIALLSKPTPTGLVVPLIGLLGLLLPRAVRSRALAYALLGTFTTVLLGAAVVLAWGIPIDVWWTYTVKLPSAVGSFRAGGLTFREIIDAHVLPWHKLFARHYLDLKQLLPNLVFWAVALIAARSRGHPLPRTETRIQLRTWILCLSLTAVTVVFQRMTNNQHTNAMAYLFLIYGLSLSGILRLLRYLELPCLGLGVTWLAIVTLLVAPLVDGAARFHRIVNIPRRVHEIDLRDLPRIDFEMPAQLAGLEIYVPERYERDFAGLHQLLRFFDEHAGNFLLLSDFTVLYALTDRSSANYPLWHHSTVSIPLVGAPEYPAFVARQIELLEEHDVRYVVRGEMEMEKDQQPWAFVDGLTEGPTRYFGGLSVTSLRRPGSAGPTPAARPSP